MVMIAMAMMLMMMVNGGSCHLNEKRIKEKLSVWGTRTCQSVVCFDDALAIKGW